MNAKVISIYAADTSGVCSALYELGGMTVVHDASGCNSTYAAHDEAAGGVDEVAGVVIEQLGRDGRADDELDHVLAQLGHVYLRGVLRLGFIVPVVGGGAVLPAGREMLPVSIIRRRGCILLILRREDFIL